MVVEGRMKHDTKRAPICPLLPLAVDGDRKVNRIKEFLLDGRRRRNPEGRPPNANATGQLLMTGVG